ncbi:response regulator, partial [Acinetobacter baumannii]
ALELISRTRPDFVIVSAVLDELSGIDVASALTAMPSTRNIPIALLTSYTWGHPSLHDLPTRVAIIRKGNSFGSDLAEFLGRF